MRAQRPGSGWIRKLAPPCLSVLIVVALSGCGGSAKPHTATSSSPGGVVTGPQSLIDHLPPITQFPQLNPIEEPNVISSAAVWVASGGLPGTPGQADAARLMKLGFLAAVRETLGSEQTNPGEVGIEVEQFRAASGARSELAYRFGQAKATGQSPGYTFGRFGVGGVPGAVGYSVDQPGTSSDAVAFADGKYFYSMQSILPARAPGAVTPRQLKIEAAGWYRHLKSL